MSFKKIVTIAAAAGALAAISLPAMAFENEFHGSSSMRYFLSNYESGGGGNPLAIDSAATTAVPAVPAVSGFYTYNADGSNPVWHAPVAAVPASTKVNPRYRYVPLPTNGNATNKLKMNNYFESRTRIYYAAKANDDLKLVTAFEIDSVFGDKAQGATTGANVPAGTGRNQGGAWESDSVNLETKNVYLQFKVPSTPVKVTAGIQTIRDGLKDIFFLADAAGVMTSTKLGVATLNAGYLRGYDQSYFNTARPKGMDNMELGILEAKLALSKDLNLGALYYLYNDGRAITNGISGVAGVEGGNTTGTLQIHTFGLTGDAKMGPLSLSGFLAYQGGVFRNVTATNDSAYLNAFAYNLAAKLAAGPGTLKTALLFTSGNGSNDGRHLKGWIGTSQSQNDAWSNAAGTSYYSEGGTWLLTRTTASSGTTDMALAYNTGNGTNPSNSQGLYLASLGYDANLTPKLYVNTNFGALWAAKTNALKPVDFNTKTQNATNYMGSEINVEAGYKMYDNITASIGGAYVLLGGYYKGASAYHGGTGLEAKDPENPYTVRTTLKFVF